MAKPSIIIIDSDEWTALTIQRAFKMFRCDADVAFNGEDGLALARLYPPNLIILEVNLPDISGYKLCQEIRHDPLLSSTPVVFLTALNEDDAEIEGLMAGADDYITKPFRMEVLHLRIRAILRRTQQKD